MWNGYGALLIEATETKQIRVASVSKGLARPKNKLCSRYLGIIWGAVQLESRKEEKDDGGFNLVMVASLGKFGLRFTVLELCNRNRQYHKLLLHTSTTLCSKLFSMCLLLCY